VAKPNPIGRPTKYQPKFCAMLIEHMADGFSFESFGALVDCSRQVVHDWVKVYPEFLEAKREGDVKAQIWWEKLHRRCAATGEGNMTGIVWAQKNKWPKQYCERVAKGQIDIRQHQTQQLNAQITGDFKSLVATLTPEQMYQLSIAMEQKTQVLEATHEVRNDKDK